MAGLQQPPGTNNAAFVSSINCDVPTYSGDTTSVVYLLVVAYYAQTVTITATTPAGWTLANTSSHTFNSLSLSGGVFPFKQSIYYKTYDASTSVSVAFSGLCTASAQVFIATEASTSSPAPITVLQTANTNDAASHVAPTLTPPYAGSLLVGVWTCPAESDTANVGFLIPFTPPASMVGDFSQTGFKTQMAGLIASEIRATTAATGTRTATTTFGVDSISTLFSINPSQVPSAPVLITPNGGEAITVGRTYTVTWNPSTSPVVAQNLLTYKVDYSSNGPLGPWNVLTGGTVAGATSYSWNTTGRTPGANYYIRVRANDGSNDGPNDVSAAAFSILADVAPSPPTNLTPNGITVDRAANQSVSWLFNDTGDVQTERTWEWGTDGVTFGTVSTVSTAATTIVLIGGAGILATRGQKYHRVKVKDNAGNASPYSATSTFFAGDKPAAPNITAPTSGLPPTEATPLITITSTGHTHYRYRFVREGSQVYDSDWITSSATSWRTVYALAEGVPFTLFVSVKNSDGLASDEDSETFTPAYVSPDQPTIAATGNDDGGYIQITAGNTGSLSHNDIYRFDDGQSPAEMIQVAKLVAANGSFQDFNVASGVTYYYIVRAVGNTAALFKDSEPSDGASVTLSKLWMHVVTKESSTSNASGTPVSLTNLESPGEDVPEKQHGREFKFSGRPKPVFIGGDTFVKSLRASCLESDSTKRSQVQAIYDAGNDPDVHVCVRDQMGEMVIGKFTSYPLSMSKHDSIEVMVQESDYSEAIS
jgi:hypothetical protein